MKLRLFLLSLLFASSAISQTFTDGVYIHDGVTTQVTKNVYSLITTNKAETYQFSNGLIVKAGTNTDFAVNSFSQVVTNLDGNPQKAQIGSANLAATLMKGNAIIVFSGHDEEGSCVISTPLMDLELYNGTFYFICSDSKVIVIVLEGSLKSHADGKKENIVTAGYATIATPSEVGLVETKVSIITEKVKQTNLDALNKQTADTVSLKNSVMFSTIDKKVVGVVIN